MLKISDTHWNRIKHCFPEENRPCDQRGRKHVPARRVVDAVLWVLITESPWHMLPQAYPNYKTVHRRFQAWAQQDRVRGLLVGLVSELREQEHPYISHGKRLPEVDR